MIQIFETQTNNTKLKEDYYVYETDTVRISYNFWAKNGVVEMEIYNKLDKPIYVDWKSSAFIYNGTKLNYWEDETISNSTGIYGGYFYKGPLTSQLGAHVSTTVTQKPEKITFIPPNSNYYRSQFYLMPISYYELSLNTQSVVVPRKDNPKKMTTVYSQDFSSENSPLKFRNFLAFSLFENCTSLFYTDNGFYLSAIKEMDYRHYRGYDDLNMSYEAAYKRTAFYIPIQNEKSVMYRKNSPIF